MREEFPAHYCREKSKEEGEGEIHTGTGKIGPSLSWVMFVAVSAFIAGMIVMAAFFIAFSMGQFGPSDEMVEQGQSSSKRTTPPFGPANSAHPIDDLRQRHLDVPVQGVHREDLKTSFRDRRGFSRRHAAIDILAARHTPVVAVEDGTIARLFHSEAGGITVYQFDPTKTFVYYYAHLDSYAKGLKEGASVKRGQMLGYVGTSGNAPKDAPHLHFAISKLTEKKQWWKGTAIDPYVVLK
jgi:murein DD-endopeptidase MepM/ murein hydrolase activator NlpD